MSTPTPRPFEVVITARGIEIHHPGAVLKLDLAEADALARLLAFAVSDHINRPCCPLSGHFHTECAGTGS